MNTETQTRDIPKGPTEAINCPQKLIAGILCLVFAVIFSALVIERLGYIALIFGVSFFLCLIYFMYVWLLDMEIFKKYKRYRNELLILVKKENPEYEVTTNGIISNASPKNIMVSLALFILIAVVALIGKGRTFSLIAAVFFTLFFGVYIYLESLEGIALIEEIEVLKGELRTRITDEV